MATQRRTVPVQRPPQIRPDFAGVVVALSKVHGRGLYAARDFKRGEHVMEYGGVKVPKKEGNRRTDLQWAKGRVYTFELSRRFDIDGSPRWNVARLANQSCDANCESHNVGGRHVWIVALRPIKKGEEITYDYNFPMTEPPPRCRCGSPKCRGYIVGEAHVADLKAWLKKMGKHGGPGLQRGKAQ